MPKKRQSSPYWDGNTHGAISAPGDDGSSDFSRAIKGLVSKVVNPNQSDPTNPVINGASQSRSWVRNILADVATQIPRGKVDFNLLSSIAENKTLNGGIVDDRDYLVQ